MILSIKLCNILTATAHLILKLVNGKIITICVEFFVVQNTKEYKTDCFQIFKKMCGEIKFPKEEVQNECQCQFNINLKLTNKEISGKYWENIAILPEEILQHIFSNLTRDSLMEAVLVCKYWNEVVSS